MNDYRLPPVRCRRSSIIHALLQAERVLTGDSCVGASPAWDPARIAGFIGVSAPYNLYALADHLNARGLNRTLFDRIMSVQGTAMLRPLSPVYALRHAPKELA